MDGVDELDGCDNNPKHNVKSKTKTYKIRSIHLLNCGLRSEGFWRWIYPKPSELSSFHHLFIQILSRSIHGCPLLFRVLRAVLGSAGRASVVEIPRGGPFQRATGFVGFVAFACFRVKSHCLKICLNSNLVFFILFLIFYSFLSNFLSCCAVLASFCGGTGAEAACVEVSPNSQLQMKWINEIIPIHIE